MDLSYGLKDRIPMHPSPFYNLRSLFTFRGLLKKKRSSPVRACITSQAFVRKTTAPSRHRTKMYYNYRALNIECKKKIKFEQNKFNLFLLVENMNDLDVM